MNIKTVKKFHKGDIVQYRHNNDVKIGEIVQAPTTYACDTDLPNIGDFYVVSDGYLTSGITSCYVKNVRDIFHYEISKNI